MGQHVYPLPRRHAYAGRDAAVVVEASGRSDVVFRQSIRNGAGGVAGRCSPDPALRWTGDLDRFEGETRIGVAGYLVLYIGIYFKVYEDAFQTPTPRGLTCLLRNEK